MNDALFALLDKGGTENRTAFLSALIMERAALAPSEVPAGPVNPHHAERIARTLVNLASRIKTRAEIACGRELEEREERADAKDRERFHAIADHIGFRAETGGDPRGPVSRLYHPTDERLGDGWGGGWGVFR